MSSPRPSESFERVAAAVRANKERRALEQVRREQRGLSNSDQPTRLPRHLR